MTDYTVDADWSGKDTLTSGSTLKVVRGSEFQIEFDAIATAIATKFDSSSAVDINSGAIDNTTIGATTAASGTFTNLTATTADINAGTLDNVTIGGTTAGAGTFTNLTATGTVSLGTSVDINGGTIDGSTITSPVINTGVSGTAVLDDDSFATASATTIATSESIKAYVDAQTASGSIAGLSSSYTGTGDVLQITNNTSGPTLIVGKLESGYISNIVFKGGEDTVVGRGYWEYPAGTVNQGGTNYVLGSADNLSLAGSVGTSVEDGNRNTAIGYQIMPSLTSGSGNIGMGYKNLQALTTGDYNVSIGNKAVGSSDGDALTTGSKNTLIGMQAGKDITTGSNNTVIGYNADVSSATISNTITLGDTNITTLRCNVTSITSLSDMRDKTNIADLDGASNFIKNLEPVSFDWARRDNTLQGVQSHGFLAQQLQSAQESTGYQVPGLVFDDNPDKLEASYGNLLPTIVAALKDALTEIDELKAKVAALESA